jgi:hypothetical protein
LIDYFSFFGGATSDIDLEISFVDYIRDFVMSNISLFEENIKPSYLLDSPYRELLIAIAKGDGKIYGAVKKARISETLGEELVIQLGNLGIIYLEESRESLLGSPNMQHKSYRAQSKIRFKIPFFRFWFGFIEPFRNEITNKNYDKVIDYLMAHYERLRSLIYEQLSNEMLIEFFSENGKKIVYSSSYWDKENEFDILALTANNEIIIAECKYKDRKVCRNELGKLKFKAEQSNLNVSHWVLFSKDGFSKELLHNKESSLTIFDIKDMQKWLLS